MAKARMRWEATLAYISGSLSGASVSSAFSGSQFPGIQEVFPSIFDGIPDGEQVPQWKIWQARVAAHANDYKRNRGDE